MTTGDWEINTAGTPQPLPTPKINFDEIYQEYQDQINNEIGIDHRLLGGTQIDTEKQDLKNRLSACEQFIKLMFQMLQGTDFENCSQWESMKHIVNTIVPQNTINVQWYSNEWPTMPPGDDKEIETENNENDEYKPLEDELFEIDFDEIRRK